MLSAFLHAAKQRDATDAVDFPDLPAGVGNLPRLTDMPCLGESCRRCVTACPTNAIQISDEDGTPVVTVDRGLCITCGDCIEGCPTQTISSERSTKTAVFRREDLILSNSKRSPQQPPTEVNLERGMFRRSVDVREVSTGCNATDLEVNATTNAIFDCSRFGIHFVASPRFADVLMVTGPVGRAMQEPLVRCYEALADPRIVVAVGTSAISGGIHRGGYTMANGVTPHLPVAAFVPGCPPNPWSIIHGVCLSTQSRRLSLNREEAGFRVKPATFRYRNSAIDEAALRLGSKFA